MALKYPEQLSEKDIFRFFYETWLIIRTMQRESEPKIINYANIGSFSIIVLSVAITYFKDLRNNMENTDPDSVLDGDIDSFLEAALYQTTKKNK